MAVSVWYSLPDKTYGCECLVLFTWWNIWLWVSGTLYLMKHMAVSVWYSLPDKTYGCECLVLFTWWNIWLWVSGTLYLMKHMAVSVWYSLSDETYGCECLLFTWWNIWLWVSGTLYLMKHMAVSVWYSLHDKTYGFECLVLFLVRQRLAGIDGSVCVEEVTLTPFVGPDWEETTRRYHQLSCTHHRMLYTVRPSLNVAISNIFSKPPIVTCLSCVPGI